MAPMPHGTHTQPPNKDLEDFFRLRFLIGEYFDVSDLHITENFIRFTVHAIRGDYYAIRSEFIACGYYPLFRKTGSRNICTLVRTRPRMVLPSREIMIASAMFAATIFTTLWAGYILAQQYVPAGGERSSIWLNAGLFSAGLLFILGCHEMGHKWAARRNGITASPPYFIPAPPPFPFGTLGAVIRVRPPMPDRNALIELGATGPILGFLAATPILMAGLALSHTIPIASLPKGEMFWFGEPLYVKLMSMMFFNMAPGHVLVLHPLAFAAWVGLLVTGLNLIPMGQLDGGHVARALLGQNNARRLSWFVVGMLLVMSWFQFTGWLLWAVIGALIIRRRMPILNEGMPISPRKQLLGIASFVIFIMTFIPAPVYSPLSELIHQLLHP